VRRAKQKFGYFDDIEDPTFRKYIDIIWTFLKSGQTNDEQKYSRFYQAIDEGDWESHTVAYLKWLDKRVQNGRGRYAKYAPIKDALHAIAIMLDESEK